MVGPRRQSQWGMPMVPLSFAQQRLWFLNRLEGPSETYNVPVVLRLTGPLDIPAFVSAVRDVVDRHESLRTVFGDRDGVPYQQVLDTSAAEVTVEVSPCPTHEVDAAVDTAVRHHFDLGAGVPVLARILVVSPEEHVFVLVMHHIVCDGWSIRPLLADLSTAYRARAAGAVPRWSPLPVRYTDFTLWQRELLGAEEDPHSLLNRQLDYWSGALAGIPDELDLPNDRPRPAASSYHGDRILFELPPSALTGMRHVARGTGATLFMVLQAAVAALLSRLGAGTDIPVGTAIAGRSEEALDDVVGFFVNTVVLRADVSGDPTLRELVHRVRRTTLEAYAHQDVPFDRVVEHLNPARSLSRNPLYQVTVELHDEGDGGLDLPGVTCVPHPFGLATVKTDLSWDFVERTGADGQPVIRGELSFSTDLFDRETAADLVRWFGLIVQGAIAAPRQPISTLSLVSTDEQGGVPHGGARPGHRDLDVGLVERLRARCLTHPDAVAVVDAAGETTYRSLVGRASRTARRLGAAGVRPGDIVAVLADRGAAVITAFLAANTIGGIYLPLDIEAPPARSASMLAAAAATVLLVESAHAGLARRLAADAGHRLSVLVLDDLVDDVEDLVPVVGSPDDLAYVIFTSGSTGRPKGALVHRRGMMNNLLGEAEAMGITGPETVAFTAPVTFDISVWQMVCALLFGGTVRAVPRDVAWDPRALFQLVANDGVTVLQVVPSLLRAALDEWDARGDAPQPGALRVLAVTGEALPAALCRRWFDRCPDVPIVNCYGPTECSDDVAHATITASTVPTESRTPIGRAVRGSRLYVLDQNLQPVPWMIPGELYVGGLVVGGGYLGDPARTAATFVADPFTPVPGGRMYRTGDVVRFRRDGQLEFVGRRDLQVKIRGQRIEPAEVEHVMRTVAGVRDAVVTAGADAAGNLRLVGYFTGDATPGDVRRQIGVHLSAAMVPSILVPMESLPLTPNGKVDRRALPAPDLPARPGRPPGTAIERTIHQVFAEVLGATGFGIDDSFFDLGGHSLSAVQVVRRIGDQLGVNLRVGAVFQHRTVASLAAAVDRPGDPDEPGAGSGDGDPLGVVLPLRPSGSRPPLWCVHPAAGVSWVYAGLLDHLDPDQPVYGLQARGLSDPAAVTDDLAGMVADHLAQIRAVQPVGPYHLAGWSFGGLVAHALAVALCADGGQVALLAILDAYPTDSGDGPTRWQPNDPHTLAELLRSVGFDGSTLPPGGPTVAEYRQSALRPGSPLVALGERAIAVLPAVFAANGNISRRSTPGIHHGDLLFFVATADAGERPDPTCWAPYVTGSVDVHQVDVRHDAMMRPDALAHIGPVLADRLRAVQTGPEPLLRRYSALVGCAVPGLDPDTDPSGSDPVDPAGFADPRTVLLTGATGFLGAFLLRRLLDSTRATVVCLVRAADPDGAHRRIRETLAAYRIPAEGLDRVTVLPGDLEQPLLGLPPRVFDELAATVDVIHHNGARVHMAETYAELERANVDGTREILRLAARHRVTPVHYVSTTGTVVGGAGAPDVLPEEWVTDPVALGRGGYEGTKWVSEQLVRMAFARGVPTTVYRPGRIVGHSGTGATGTNDAFWHYVRACVELGAVPEDAADVLTDTLAPVDHVAAALVTLATRARPDGATYHLLGAETRLQTVVAAARALGHAIDPVPYAEWHARLFAAVDSTPPRPGSSVHAVAMFEHGRAAGLGGGQHRYRLSDDHTRRALAGSGVVCPALDASLLERCCAFLTDAGFLPEPPCRR